MFEKCIPKLLPAKIKKTGEKTGLTARQTDLKSINPRSVCFQTTGITGTRLSGRTRFNRVRPDAIRTNSTLRENGR